MPEIDFDTRVVRSPEPIWADAGDGLIMMSLEQLNYFGLNQTAETVWRAMEQPVTVRALSQVLTSVYDVDEARAAAAVVELVGRMIEARIASVES